MKLIFRQKFERSFKKNINNLIRILVIELFRPFFDILKKNSRLFLPASDECRENSLRKINQTRT